MKKWYKYNTIIRILLYIVFLLTLPMTKVRGFSGD